MSVSIDGFRIPFAEDSQPAARPELGRADAPEESADRSPSRFESVLHGIGQNIDAGERIVADAASGYSSLGPAELIALQAGIYRYSEAIDLTAKLVDRATSAVRAVLSGGH
jgi:hypothetical protein